MDKVGLKWIKGLIIFSIFLASVFYFAGTTFAMPDIGKVLVNDNRGEQSVLPEEQETKTIYVSRNAVSITVNTTIAGAVYIGKVAAEALSEQQFIFKNFFLKPGNNKIKIEAKDEEGTASFNLTVIYLTTPIVDAEYFLLEIPSSGKIEAFEGALSLKLPKNCVLISKSQGVAEDQSSTFKACGQNNKPKYFTFASPVFEINVGGDYKFLQPGELTLEYDKTISNVVGDLLAVWYSPNNNWNDNDNEILGGITNTSKNTITIPFQLKGGKGYYVVFLANNEFKDVMNHWSYYEVMTMWAKGLMEQDKSVNDETYFGLINSRNSDIKITRREFATMMVKGLGLSVSEGTYPTKETSTFEDVYEGYEYAYEGYNGNTNYNLTLLDVKLIEIAASKGIIQGFPGGLFKPEALLTRAQAAVIVSRVANLKVSDDAEKSKDALARIFPNDNYDNFAWACSSILAAYKARLIKGAEDGKFEPDKSLTRAEAATLTYRLFKKLKKI